jgi:hypothetical protein
MRKFAITSPKFKGKVEAMYNLDGQLSKIDFSAAELNEDGVKWLKHRISASLEGIFDCFKDTGLSVQEEDFEVTFEDFWREYPYKRNKHLASDYWLKMTTSQQYTAFMAAIEYRKYCDRNKWYNAMIADTWLKKGQFKNDWKNL